MGDIERRTFVTTAVTGLIVTLASGRVGMASQEKTTTSIPRFAYVGSRTTKERKARGRGIEVYRILDREEVWEPIQTLSDLTNPSFLITDTDGRYIFTVHGDMSEITSFKIDSSSGELQKIGSADTRGKNPVHAVPHNPSKSLLVANYATGSLVRIPVSSEGKLGEAGDPLSLPGEPGPHKTEQSSSHPHQIVADPANRFFLVPDKGLDQIFTVSVDASGTLSVISSVTTRQGAGPRHIVFGLSGEFAYAINELDSTLTTYRYAPDTGTLKALQIVSSVPQDFVGGSRAAAITISKDGRSIYATNRGHNSVVHLKIDERSGLLNVHRWHSTSGSGPRFAAVSKTGRTLFVANELSDTVVSFAVADDGGLTPNEFVVKTGSPVSIIDV